MRAEARTGRSKDLVVLSFTLVVVMLGFGMVVPIYPFFVQRLGAVFDLGPSYPYLSGSAILLVVFLLSPVWLRTRRTTKLTAPAGGHREP